MAFRFVHAADIHLDSPLRSLAIRDPDLADLIGNATRRAFSRTVEICLEEGVDALLLAGDLYDGDQTSMKTALFLAQELKRLDAAGIRTFIIRGNHDHLSRITKELELPDSTMVFGGRADAVPLTTAGGLSIVVHGMSFAQATAPDSLLPRYKAPVPDAINIGLMHTSLGGSHGHDPYAPCSVADLTGSGFRYWGLGHIHMRSVTDGACAITMPGMPQGRDIGEAGPKSVTLVTVADDGSIATEERHTSVAQFERVTVDVSGAEDWRGVAERIGEALEDKRQGVASEHLVARITMTGANALAWRMRRDVDLLRTEAEARALGIGRTWIDKLEIDVSPPSAPVGAGPFDELRRSMVEDVRGSQQYVAAVLAAMEELRGRLPPESRGVLGDDETTMRAIADELADRGCEEVVARLAETGRSDADAS